MLALDGGQGSVGGEAEDDQLAVGAGMSWLSHWSPSDLEDDPFGEHGPGSAGEPDDEAFDRSAEEHDREEREKEESDVEHI